MRRRRSSATRSRLATSRSTDRFDLGFVEAPDGKHLMVGGKSIKKALFEAGPRVVTIADEEQGRRTCRSASNRALRSSPSSRSHGL